MTPIYFWCWAYGIVLGAAVFLALLHSRRLLTPRAFGAGVLATAGLIVGAKLQYRLEAMPIAEALRLSPVELFEPGMRIPLGMLLGGLSAGLGCMALGVPWRSAGDALAVGALTVIPIGRIGCFLNGCCMGTVCGRWALPLCLGYPPGSEVYEQQVREQLLPMTAAVSLPVHPLPLYFAAGALAIVLVLLRTWRRAAPGVTLLVACVLGSAGKVALETLRAEVRPPEIMYGIPLLTLAVSLAIVPVLFRRTGRRVRFGNLAKANLVVIAAMWGVLTPAGLGAVEPSGEVMSDAAAAAAIAAYAEDPRHNRRQLRALEHQREGDAPPLLLLAMADARLRAGQRRAAAALFEELLEAHPEEPFGTWARLGLGWNDLLADDVDGARSQFDDIASGSSRAGTFARLLVALIDASRGRRSAVETFDRIAIAGAETPALRDVARLGGAYARYWRADYAAAADAFERIGREIETPTLGDDVRYGAALARVRAGDRERGRAALRALAEEVRQSRGVPSQAMVELEPGALLRVGFERYRRGPLRPPEAQAAALLDCDGPMMARMALKRLDEPRDGPTRVSTAAPRERTVRPVALEPRAPRRADSTRVAPDERPSHLPLVASIAVVLLAIAVVVGRRARPRPSRRLR